MDTLSFLYRTVMKETIVHRCYGKGFYEDDVPDNREIEGPVG